MFRTVFLYFYALLNVRLAGKQGLNSLSPFQLIIVVALGSAIGDPMFDDQTPLIDGMIVISTILFIEQLIMWATSNYTMAQRIVEGSPALVIHHGHINYHELARQRLGHDELMEMLRLKGVKNTGHVEYAFLEPSGNLSVIPYDYDKRTTQLTLTVPEETKK